MTRINLNHLAKNVYFPVISDKHKLQVFHFFFINITDLRYTVEVRASGRRRIVGDRWRERHVR